MVPPPPDQFDDEADDENQQQQQLGNQLETGLGCGAVDQNTEHLRSRGESEDDRNKGKSREQSLRREQGQQDDHRKAEEDGAGGEAGRRTA